MGVVNMYIGLPLNGLQLTIPSGLVAHVVTLRHVIVARVGQGLSCGAGATGAVPSPQSPGEGC